MRLHRSCLQSRAGQTRLHASPTLGNTLQTHPTLTHSIRELNKSNLSGILPIDKLKKNHLEGFTGVADIRKRIYFVKYMLALPQTIRNGLKLVLLKERGQVPLPL